MMNEHDITIINNRIAADRREKLERLRDEFAMHALEVFISKQSSNSYGDYDHDRASKLAYKQADSMLKARGQSK